MFGNKFIVLDRLLPTHVDYKVKINRQNKCSNINICGKKIQLIFSEEKKKYSSLNMNLFSLLFFSFSFNFVLFVPHPDQNHSYVVELLVIFTNFEMCVHFEMAYFLTHKMASSQSIFKVANFIRQMFMMPQRLQNRKQ